MLPQKKTQSPKRKKDLVREPRQKTKKTQNRTWSPIWSFNSNPMKMNLPNSALRQSKTKRKSLNQKTAATTNWKNYLVSTPSRLSSSPLTPLAKNSSNNKRHNPSKTDSPAYNEERPTPPKIFQCPNQKKNLNFSSIYQKANNRRKIPVRAVRKIKASPIKTLSLLWILSSKKTKESTIYSPYPKEKSSNAWSKETKTKTQSDIMSTTTSPYATLSPSSKIKTAILSSPSQTQPHQNRAMTTATKELSAESYLTSSEQSSTAWLKINLTNRIKSIPPTPKGKESSPLSMKPIFSGWKAPEKWEPSWALDQDLWAKDSTKFISRKEKWKKTKGKCSASKTSPPSGASSSAPTYSTSTAEPPYPALKTFWWSARIKTSQQ